MRIISLAAFLVVLALAAGAGPRAVSADTQWYGSSYGKTYRNNWGWYPVSQIADAWCGGGAWGGTYNDYYYVTKRAALWTEKWDRDFWGFWGWRYQGYTVQYAYGYSPAETTQYNARCTRGATDHRIVTWGHYWTTSDGF